MTRYAFILLCILCGALFGRAHPGNAATIHVVNHGWHTGLVIRRGDIPAGLWPEHRQAPPGEYLEVGWGQREFYQTRDPSLLQALGAAVWPGASVLHLVGFNGQVTERFPHSEIIALTVDNAAMARLVRYIADAYERDADGNVKRLGAGLHGDSRFFAGREDFHLLRTCNVWTAHALRRAGCPVGLGITAENVMSSAAKCGTPVP
ncbi:MAG: DUF2459 domain-containing protein [Alphaproteobacteria bacterium]|jgi:uncharacterized protein (TIGR02117 family)